MTFSSNDIDRIADVVDSFIRAAPDAFQSAFDIAGKETRSRSFASIEKLCQGNMKAAVREAIEISATAGFLERLLAAWTNNIPSGGDLRTLVPQDLMRKALEGEHQAVFESATALIDVTIADVVSKVGPMIGVIRDSTRSNEYIGTGFLVGPDLFLTAAHVVWHMIDFSRGNAPIERPGASDSVQIEFHNRGARDGKHRPRVTQLAPGWLECCSEPCGAPPKLDLLDDTLAATNFDFALIRLTDRIGDLIGYLDIHTPADAQENTVMAIVGHPGGTACKFHSENITVHHREIGRLRHRVSTSSGMSGGACLDKMGPVLGIHEGTAKNTYGKVEYNRSVHLQPIRKMIAAMPIDPLSAHSRYLTWLPLDSSQEVFKSLGYKHKNTDQHPIIGRTEFQDWIKDACKSEPASRFAIISGVEGSGKSFSEKLMRAKLKDSGDVVVSLPPEVARAADILALFARLTSAAVGDGADPFASPRRPDIGTLRHDIIPQGLEKLELLLKRPSHASSSRLWLFIDFGRDEGWLSGHEEDWMASLNSAVQKKWMRIVLAGISETRQAEFRAIFSPIVLPFLEHTPTLEWTEVSAFVAVQLGSKVVNEELEELLTDLKDHWERAVVGKDGCDRAIATIKFA